MVIPERRILLTAERRTVEVVINSRVTSTIIGVVVSLVDPDVSVPINRYIVAPTKLLHVTINIGVSITIHLSVFRATRREVSFAINRNIVITLANGLIPLDVSRAKLLVPRDVLFPRRVHLVLFGHRV